MQIDITLEQALQRATAPLRRKMQHSVELLRKAERLAMHYDPQDGYFLAFSGGKDSQALYHMAQLAGIRFQAHMNLTSVDPPEVIRFVRRQYPDVQMTKPKDSIYNIAVQRQILPTMRVRWCCAEYKETAGAGRVTLIGIRHQESSRRAKRNEVEISSRKFSGTLDGLDEYRAELKAKREKKRSQQQDGVNITNATDEQTVGCIHGKESLLISPIIDWTERDVWEFLNDVVRVAHCELYDQGWHRIGCINCPMASAKQKQIENERWPHVRRNWIKAIMRIRAGGGISEQTYLQNGGGRNSYQKDIWRAESPSGAVLGGRNQQPVCRGLHLVEHPSQPRANAQPRTATAEGFSEQPAPTSEYQGSGCRKSGTGILPPPSRESNTSGQTIRNTTSPECRCSTSQVHRTRTNTGLWAGFPMAPRLSA